MTLSALGRLASDDRVDHTTLDFPELLASDAMSSRSWAMSAFKASKSLEAALAASAVKSFEPLDRLGALEVAMMSSPIGCLQYVQ